MRFLILLIFSGYGHLYAQNSVQMQQTDSIAVSFMQAGGGYSVLYTGSPHERPLSASNINHQYFNDHQFALARLSYRGILYPNEYLRFDLSRQELIIRSPKFASLVLSPEYVDFADLHGKHIIYFRHDSLKGSPSTGYYFLLHSGKCNVLEKNIATLKVFSQHDLHYTFSKRFYLYHADAYYTIRNKRSLLKVLQPHKKELKKFISSNKLRFKNDADLFIPKIVAEYEKLSESL